MSRVAMEVSLAKMYGEQPEFDYSRIADADYHNAKAFDWFNANLPSSKKREVLVEYAKYIGSDELTISALSALDLSDILFSNAVYAKMLTCGAILHPAKKENFDNHFNYYVDLGRSRLAAKAAKNGGTVSNNVQTYIKDRLIELSADLNYTIDKFIESGFKSSFDPSTWLVENDVKAIYCDKLIADILNPIFIELAIVVKETDMELVEGWSHLTPTEARSLASFVWMIMEAFRGRVEVAKTERMPRIRKPKPPAKQVKGLKYKAHDVTFGVSSIDPKKIVGATELFVFNTKTRALCVFIADDAKGFTVKGSTLMGVDFKKSYSKTLRKPNETIPVILKHGKKAITKEMESIRAVAKSVKGRINKDMILLRGM